ncbi:tryptophanyl-tRNA synthetase [Bradyrhizobium sp. AZCC 1721]
MIEQTNEIVRRINRQAGVDVLPEARALIPRIGRLPGIDGKAKMSKSQGNAIQLSATADEIRKAVRRMFTDPNHIKASDPGRVEGNVVFKYLDAFDEDHVAVEDLKARYVRGGLGDSIVKKRLDDVLQALLAPIRSRRRALARDPGYLLQVVKLGTSRAREITDATLRDVRAALGLFTLN